MNDGRAALDISVIVCAYTEDRWDAMGAAIESLHAQSIPAGEIILAIDHNPRLFDRARETFPDVVVVKNSGERGLSGARNSGIAVARGDLLAFVDEDAVAAPDWLEQLRAEYANEAVVGVGGAIEPLWLEGRPRWFPEEFNWVVGCTYLGIAHGSEPVRNLIGCNMSFRREVFDTVGGFRSGIGRVGTRPVGCEETELCIRVRQHWPERILLYTPGATVHHRVPEDRARPRYFRARCYAEGLSKALVARLVGAGDGLSSERAYTMRTLPMGVGRGLRDTLFHGDFAGMARAGAIVAGLAVTTAGYLAGTIQGSRMAEDRYDGKRRAPKSNRAACDRFHAD
ncbi:MAG: glycosyltransferase family 2 protein [Chloroflexia bacterium]